MLSNITVVEEGTNVSDHNLVRASLLVEARQAKSRENRQGDINLFDGKLNWSKCDHTIYKETLKKELDRPKPPTQEGSVYNCTENIQYLKEA